MRFFWKTMSAGAGALIMLAACSNQAQHTTGTGAPTTSAIQNAARPLPAETNPPGDIPDTQVFVSYTSASGHYNISYPEGWQRTEQGSTVTFVHDFDGQRVRVAAGPKTVITLATAGFLVVRAVRASVVKLPGRIATLVAFTSNSMPNAVTGKRVRLENNTYVFSSGARTALLDLWAPLGSDNVDQWRRILRSFRWQ